MVTTHLPQSVGISSCPRQRCTQSAYDPKAARSALDPRSGDDCLNFPTVSPDGNHQDLSTVAQDYLKVIWTAQEWSREKVSTKLLAERIGVSASTASESIRKLADQGLVHHEKYGAVTLTDAGRSAALAMVRRHRLMETFLVQELGYSWDEVHDEAEILEHAVSDRMLDRIDAKLGHPPAIRTAIRSPRPTARFPPRRPGSRRRARTATPARWPGSQTPIRRCCGTSTASASASIPGCGCWRGVISPG